MGCLSIITWKSFFIKCVLTTCSLGDIFLPSSELSFHFLDGVSWSAKALNFLSILKFYLLIFFLLSLVFFVSNLRRNSLIQHHKDLFLCVKSSMLLESTYRLVILFQLIFVSSVKQLPQYHLLKKLFLSHWIFLTLWLKISDHKC